MAIKLPQKGDKSIFRSTVLPFLIIAVMALFGLWILPALFPDAWK